MQKFLFIIFSNFIFLYGNSYDLYISKSNELKLDKDPYWHTLLHMSSNKSEIDNKEFFISPIGKIDAKAEMNATIEAFFEHNESICKYPARYHWLKDRLKMSELEKIKCEEFDKFVKTVDPKSVTLVFPTAHISSPASMFGHTFIRIDSSYESKMLSSAINYSASANQDTENGFAFAIKGLFGGYSGQYSLLPYYDKLKEYRDKDQRDIWEYQLNLNSNEIMQMIRHIWELKDTRSDYYFFDENCAYNMLWLLEVAREGLNLRSHFIYHVSPPETIFAMKEENLISNTHYRPSKRTKILAYDRLLSDKNKRVVKKVLSTDISSIDDKNISIQDKQHILEFAVELNENSFINNKIKKDEYLSLSHQLLLKRSLLGESKEVEIKEPNNPLKAHRGFKLTMQEKIKNGEESTLLGFRPVYHDMADSDRGMIDGTEIKFLDFLFEVSDKSIEVESVDILKLSSLVNVSTFSKPFSWSARFAFDKNAPDENLNFDSSVQIGFRKNIFDETNYFYYLVGFGTNEYDDWSAYATHKLGFTWSQNEFGKLNVELNQRKFTNGFLQFNTNMTQSFYLNQHIGIQFGYETKERENWDRKDDIFRAVGNYYF